MRVCRGRDKGQSRRVPPRAGSIYLHLCGPTCRIIASMAPDYINLISSSPQGGTGSQGPLSPKASYPRPTPRQWSATSLSRPPPPKPTGLDLDADVLDIEIDRDPKRRRIEWDEESHHRAPSAAPFIGQHRARTAVEPIEFTSSLERPSPAKKAQQPPQPTRDSFVGAAIDSDPFASSPPTRNHQARRAVSLDPFDSSPVAKRAPSTNTSAPQGHSEPSIIDIDDYELDNDSDDLPALTDIQASGSRQRSFRRWQSDTTASRQRSTQRPAMPRQPTKSHAEREAEKERKRLEREAAKQLKAQEKQRAAALAEANKLLTDRKASTTEMIVDLPSGVDSEVLIQAQEMLTSLEVAHSTVDGPHDMVKWRRKVTRRFNDDLNMWEPVSPRILSEDTVLLVMKAEQLVSLATDNGLTEYMSQIKSHLGSLKVLILVQGMTPWLRKNRNVRNRQFTTGVRSSNAPAAGGSAAARTTAEYISEDVVEDAMLSLQVHHGALIHHTTVATETARWIANFTQHISTVPYKKQREQATSVAGFCMDTGQVRTGENALDTYVRMLQEIMRVTAPIAYGVAGQFDTVSKLVRGLEAGGPETVGDVRKSANKDGALSDRAIGQAVSRRLYKVFTGQDELSTDV